MYLDTMPYENHNHTHFQTELQDTNNTPAFDFNTDNIIDDHFFPTTDNLNNCTLTESQYELVEKFNAAFLEAQNNGRTTQNTFNSQNTIQDTNFHNDNYQFDSDSDTNLLLDIFLSKSPSTEQDSQIEVESSEFSNETCENYGFVIENDDGQNSVFYVSPPLRESSNQEEIENLEDIDLSDIDFCDNLSNSWFDIETITSELCESENLDIEYDNTLAETHDVKQEKFEMFSLPSVTTFRGHFAEKRILELNNFIRNSPADSINIFAQEQEQKNLYGHLLSTKSINNNISSTSLPYTESSFPDSSASVSNQIILPQSEAILHDDPLLSSSSVIFPKHRLMQAQTSDDFNQLNEETSEDCYSTQDNSESETADNYVGSFQCKWEECYEVYTDQKTLVRHIEKLHVEMKKGEEFSCLWAKCPRKNRPFNARYKLLIHMRVHSGEKPNKCPFTGCTKAFSRLENLKIHQRSHTGERPYLCQFAHCPKSFSNSSDRAKHQRTHLDTKPYACQITGCQKRYTDPSSLRKHVKNHSLVEQAQLKRQQQLNREFLHKHPEVSSFSTSRHSPIKNSYPSHTNTQYGHYPTPEPSATSETSEHSYSTCAQVFEEFVTKEAIMKNVKIDLKNKISEKHRQKRLSEMCTDLY